MRPANQTVLWSVLLDPYFVPVCFTLYISLRAALMFVLPIDQYSDSLWYYARGLTIASGKGYSEGGIATAYWPPGWPGFLGLVFWLFGPSAVVGKMANLALAAMIFPIALGLGSAIFADRLVGRLTVLMLTIYPNQIGYVPVLATEVFYTALLLLAIFLLVRSHSLLSLVLSGIVFGIATLTKAQTLFIPAMLFAVWWVIAGNRLHLFPWIVRAAILYTAMIVVIAPWTVRNYMIFGEFVLISTNGGGTLLSGNNPSASGDYTENDALVKQVPNDVAGQIANDRLATSLALKWIRENPIDFAILIPKKVWRLWAPDGESEWSYQAGYKWYDEYWMFFRAARVLNQVYYTFLIGLLILSIVYFMRQHRMMSPYSVTGYTLIAYFTAISIVFSGQSRFHFPLMPWVAMYAAWTITQWADRDEPARRTVMIRA
jgi:hypothetical protein